MWIWYFLTLTFSDTKLLVREFSLLEENISVIRDFPQPTSQCKLWEFLALVNFYHRFILSYLAILLPQNDLLSYTKTKTQELHWNINATESFQTVKATLANITLLMHPKPNAPNCNNDWCFWQSCRRCPSTTHWGLLVTNILFLKEIESIWNQV